ncbi:L,D-transpeptidase family protein [Brevibacillus daliensis]|uniref:L,D-transpeptidase family protein n=1 Tax=Brevibacillus daliensis TaxID=2892995 RepID=UPI001E5FCAFB|nr:L,D-transpeptidase family protein [Brevibacillus daliensis]
MGKVLFFQEKSLFHMKYPEQGDLTFYRWFTEHHPDMSIGWYHLGREYEQQGNNEKALEAYRESVHAESDSFQVDALEAYHNLLRKRKHQRLMQKLRSLFTALFFLYSLLWMVPSPLTDPDTKSALQQNLSALPNFPGDPSHVEVIAVPNGLSPEQLSAQVLRYIDPHRPLLNRPYSIIVVPEKAGVPLFTPLPFFHPKEIYGVLRYDPVKRKVLEQKWFNKACICEQDQLVHKAKIDLAHEQRILEHIITLRNSLYRHYQKTGQLPKRLSDLAGPFPTNALPEIPLLQSLSVVKKESSSISYLYRPSYFRSNDAWNSMKEVLPLPGYPEPTTPLEPLQIHLHQATHTMSLMSGSHLVRRYPVALGKNNATPKGHFTILQKINRPKGHDNIYGTRGLTFLNSGYAIHGTNHPESIGHSVSLGCVRLHNKNVEELYSFVSPGTELIISSQSPSIRQWNNSVPFLLPAGADEETPEVVYSWLH